MKHKEVQEGLLEHSNISSHMFFYFILNYEFVAIIGIDLKQHHSMAVVIWLQSMHMKASSQLNLMYLASVYCF